MAEGTGKRVGNDKDQSGCMWGLINIFDFRHGSPSQKLLADRKRGSKRIAGAATPSPSHILNRLEDPCEICKDAIDGEQYETATIDKLSVKALMEEEMFEQHIHSDLDLKQTEADKQGHGRKRRWHANKKSFDLSDVHITAEKPTHRKHKSLSSLDVTGVMAELCSQVHERDIDCLNHDQPVNDVSVPPKEDPSVTEERLGEATRVFVRHFVDGRNTEEGKIQPSGELMDALQILNSNKDMFLKLLRDPSSELVKHLEKLEENSEAWAGSDLIGQGKCKHHIFFWRRFKSLDKNLSKKNERPQDARPIVVLKPQTASPQSSQDIRSEEQNERASSRFFFIEFTRKLKLAMRKEQPHSGSVDDVGRESLRMASPSRSRFFIEKISKSSVSAKKSGKECSLYGSASTPEQRISNIYTEAKRHLAEIVGNSDVDVEELSRQAPKSLGRIISYSDYNNSPLCSPRKDAVNSLQTPAKESKSGNEIAAHQVQEENVSDAGSANNKSCTTAEETGDDLELPKDEHSPLHPAVDEIRTEETRSPGDIGTEKRMDTLSEPRSPSTSRNEPVEEAPENSEEEQTMNLNLDEIVIHQPSSPLASSSVSSMNEDFDDPEAITDRSERPSPISVLETIFIEDDVSPPNIKSLPVSELIQSRQIIFEDLISRAPRSRSREEERDAVFEFVEVVVLESNLTHDQLLERSLFSEHLLDPSLFDQVCFHPDYLGYDPKLIFDLVDEVLTEVCGRDFDGIPSSYQPFICLKLKRQDLVDEIRKGVDWYLQSEHSQCTLDQTVAKAFSKPWSWMDLRLDCESIGIEMEEEIFDELVEDAITSFIGLNLGEEAPILSNLGEEAPILSAETQTEMVI